MSWNAPNLPADKHRFFDRHGGVSNGRYESLNVNRKSADAPENIRQNINIAAGLLPYFRSCCFKVRLWI